MPSRELRTDIAIIGGGTGGVAAALAIARMGGRCIVTEPTGWVGGQLTSQAVPPDENRWIERFGCTESYRRFRDGVRCYYREHYPLAAPARGRRALNPGGGWVSKLCHEPKVALAVLEQMLAWPQTAGQVQLMRFTEPVSVDADGDLVRAVKVRNIHTGEETTITARFFLDATELGDLLPLANVEYRSGAESRSDFGEPHAPEGPPQPDNVQAITWCFPMAFDPAPGADHRIEKPEQYDRWRGYVPQIAPPWPGRLLAWEDPKPGNLDVRRNMLFDEERAAGRDGVAFWKYRQIVTAEHYAPADQPHEVTLVNWPMNDYFIGNIIDKPREEVARHLQDARQLSLSLLYWLQTDASNWTTGGTGYPGLYLRPDMTGTPDGLAMHPYIRESRRIMSRFTVTELHVGKDARQDRGEGDRSEPFADSVGIGHYNIDLHMSTGGNNYIDVHSLPFRIPLGSLVPVRVRNLLPACKNLGVTHITNGCYRLHPVEWNIGESAGLLAMHCLQERLEPQQVHENHDHVRAFQKLLVEQGIELVWPWESL
jgi:hypothetical protein